MCGNYSKTKSETMKHCQKDHIFFFVILNHRSWDFKPLLEKAKPTSVDSSSDKPKALIRNIAFQPLKAKNTKPSYFVAQGYFCPTVIQKKYYSSRTKKLIG